MKKTETKSFWALNVTQFFGAYNDNVLKVLVEALAIEWIINPVQRDAMVYLSGAVFVAPFLLFSMIAGRLADRYGKPRIIRATKIWELLVVSVALFSFFMHNLPLMIVSLFMLSTQATFFSPAKYGILPELMGESELSNANGVMNLFTFSAILLGTVTVTFFAGHKVLIAVCMAIASIVGLAVSFWIESLPPAKAEEALSLNPFSDLVENWRIIKQDKALTLSILSANYFWFIGAVLQMEIFLYVVDMMHGGRQTAGFLLLSVTVGIGVGSFMAGRLSKGKVELGIVPIGALGMSLFGMDLLWAYHHMWRALIDCWMLGFCGGLYEIPLASMIQWRSPAAERGRILATTNFMSFVAILGASIILAALRNIFHLNPAQVFFTLGFLSLAGAIIVCCYLPDALLRFILYVVTNTLYKIKLRGDENIPTKGPALLVCNHLSLADGFLVGGSIPRLVRFIMWRPYFEAKGAQWFWRTLKAIPVSETDPPKEVVRSLTAARKALEEGHLVCLFAEGQISRTGNLLEFKRGFEVIAKGLEVPIIPVSLDRVWGSIFSFEHGKAIWKRPRRLPYPVTITFGKPIMSPASSSTIRQAVLDLSADAFADRLAERQSLPIEFLHKAKSKPGVLAVADSSGKEFSFRRMAAVSHVLAERLRPILRGDSTVGLLIPSSLGGALANVAVALLGKTPVNLNYTAGNDTLKLCIEKAGIQHIIATRKLLEKMSIPETPNMIFIEDLAAELSKVAVIKALIIFTLAPWGWIKKHWGKDALVSIDETATILFSSGSTGVPKGVVLSHANILSNILGLGQVFDVGPTDRMVGVLPFFHSFGYTATLWFPLVAGFSAIYHVNPLDAKIIGDLSQKHKATLLLATPTFLLAYIRKCTKENFATLRYAITGAERLRESIAQSFEEKFGVAPLEGYGCTELAPVATVNVPNVSMGEINQVGRKAGKIGHPIPGVSVKIVDPTTFEIVPQGERGLLLVKGSNVMKGYLNEPAKTAEVMHDGWYITGDIAIIDNDGFVQLVDRLSRFSKIGGEMVPHVLLEEKLQTLSGAAERQFVVTAVPDEKRGEQLVVLYSGFEGSVDELRKKLAESGVPNLWIPGKDRFFSLEKLPYLGTGKLDLTAMKSIAVAKVQSNKQI